MKKYPELVIDPTHFIIFIDRLRLANHNRKQFLAKAKNLLGNMNDEKLEKLAKLLDEHTTTPGVDHSVFTPEFLVFNFMPLR